MRKESPLNGPGWLLVAGCALAALGLARPPLGNSQDGVTQAEPIQTLTTGGSTADSNDRMIAVTGVDITGSSILYLVDTENLRLAVYQATGGTASMNNVRLIGARRIDLDMQLDGLNDKSEYSYKELRQLFTDQGLLDGETESTQDSSGD